LALDSAQVKKCGLIDEVAPAMSDPHKPTPEFGSEVRCLETPEHRRQRRRSGITASIFGIALGALLGRRPARNAHW
jgi:hypothetical protein